MTNIPLAILKPLVNDDWDCSDYALNKFDELIEHHSEADKRTGTTLFYIFSNMDFDPCKLLTQKELSAIIKTGIIPEVFYREFKDDEKIALNQHYMFSLEQFYAHCQKEWDEHLARTNSLIGTPAGTCWTGEKSR